MIDARVAGSSIRLGIVPGEERDPGAGVARSHAASPRRNSVLNVAVSCAGVSNRAYLRKFS